MRTDVERARSAVQKEIIDRRRKGREPAIFLKKEVWESNPAHQ